MRVPLLIAALAALAAPPASAQERWLYQIRVQLEDAARTLAEIRFERVPPPITGRLANATREFRLVNLTAGEIYALVGVCDDDCRDLDLRLFAPDSSMFSEDVETDDTPVLEFTAPATGPYRLEIMMPGCATSPCYWGVQLFRKRR